MKIWSTKYCLSEGITEHDVRICGSGDMVEIREGSLSYPTYLHGEGKDWHKTRKSAVARAEEVKIKKLKALDRQIKKISDIEFDE